MMNKEISIEKQQKGLLWFLVVTVISAFIFCMMHDCGDDNPMPTLHIKLEQQKIKENIAILKQIDTLTVYKTKVVYKYKTLYDTILKQAPDTCISYLITLDKECSKKDSVNEVLINDYSKVVANYKDIIVLKDYKHSQDSNQIETLKKEIPKAKRTGYFKGLRHGTALGIAIDEGLRAGIKAVIP